MRCAVTGVKSYHSLSTQFARMAQRLALWFLSCSHFAMTQGDLLRYAIALIRARKVVRGLKHGLTEKERYAVADEVVSQLRQHGDPWELSEEARPRSGPTTS